MRAAIGGRRGICRETGIYFVITPFNNVVTGRTVVICSPGTACAIENAVVLTARGLRIFAVPVLPQLAVQPEQPVGRAVNTKPQRLLGAVTLDIVQNSIHFFLRRDRYQITALRFSIRSCGGEKLVRRDVLINMSIVIQFSA